MALFIAASLKEVSTPLSNLKLASVCKPCDLDVFRIEVGLKTADSMKMEVVSFEIPEYVANTDGIGVKNFRSNQITWLVEKNKILSSINI